MFELAVKEAKSSLSVGLNGATNYGTGDAVAVEEGRALTRDEQLANFRGAIDDFKNNAPLGCCFTLSPVRNGLEYTVGAVFFAAGVGLLLTGLLTDQALFGWASLVAFSLVYMISVVFTWQKQRMIPVLDNHHRLGAMLDVVYQSHVQALQNLEEHKALTGRLEQQVGTLSDLEVGLRGEVAGLTETKGQLEAKVGDLSASVDRLETLNTTLSTMTQNLTSVINAGGDDLKELIEEAKKGHGVLWEKCLALDKVSKELAETGRRLTTTQRKLEAVLDEVLNYPDMKEFHESIQKLTPRFPGIIAIAGKTVITPEQAQELKSFIETIQQELSELDEQEHTVAGKIKEAERALRVCLHECASGDLEGGAYPTP
jgi:hypothetical protein